MGMTAICDQIWEGLWLYLSDFTKPRRKCVLSFDPRYHFKHITAEPIGGEDIGQGLLRQ